MLVREIMSTCIAECTEETPLARVYESMRNCGHGVVVVIESRYHRIPIGVVTEHTICEQIIGRQRNPQGLSAANVMSSKIVKVADSSNVSLCPVITDHDSAIPLLVVDTDRNLCGLLPKEVLRLARAEQIIHNDMTQQPAGVDDTPMLGWTQ